MALSPNYGFPEPDNTSLVKNGAQAMRDLGNSIDTFLNRPLTYNGVINGAMQVAQRGTSFTVAGSGVNTLDRWKAVIFSGSSTVSQQLTSDTTNLPNIQYCQRVVRAAGVTGVGPDYLAQSFENLSSTQYAGKTISFSFYARKGAGFTGTFTANVISGTGTNQNFIDVAITGQATVIAQTATLTTTWQRFTYTGTVASTAAQVFVYFTHQGTGTAPANDYFEVTGVQLEIGSQASPFQTASGGSIQGELAMCQRYYERTMDTIAPFGSAYSTTFVDFYIPFKVTKRQNPILSGSGLTVESTASGGAVSYNTGTFTIPSGAANYARVRYTHGTAVFVAGTTWAIYGTFIAYDAEL